MIWWELGPEALLVGVLLSSPEISLEGVVTCTWMIGSCVPRRYRDICLLWILCAIAIYTAHLVSSPGLTGQVQLTHTLSIGGLLKIGLKLRESHSVISLNCTICALSDFQGNN